MIQVLNLEDPKARRFLREHVAKTAITALCSMLGAGFTAHDELDPLKPRIWNAVRLDLFQFEKLDKVIEELQLDIIKTGVRNFIRLSETPDTTTVIERDGIVLRVTLYPGPMLEIDYAGFV